MGEFERRIDFMPSYDWRRDNPKRDYSICEMQIRFVLKGQKGAVQWLIGTNWYVESARKHLSKFPRWREDEGRVPRGWDLGYHSPVPHYEGHSPMGGECDVLVGKCFYDGSGLNARLLMEGFLSGGDEWLWGRLEAYYRHAFEGAEWPDFAAVPNLHPDDRKSPEK